MLMPYPSLRSGTYRYGSMPNALSARESTASAPMPSAS